MNAQDILDYTGFLVDDEFELNSDGTLPKTYVALMNACSGAITDAARYLKTIDLLFTAGATSLTLPSDVHKLIPKAALWLDGQPVPEVPLDDTVNAGYVNLGATLELRQPPTEDKTYKLYYFAKLPRLTGDPDEVPVIPEQFHEVYSLFIAMRYVQNYQDSSELGLKKDFEGEYNGIRAELDAYTMTNVQMPYSSTKDVLPKITSPLGTQGV